jgi:carbamoyltransferase
MLRRQAAEPPPKGERRGRITLGVHAYTHDSAAALVRDGVVVAAAEEERFDGIKHTDAFPHGAVAFCLEQAGITLADVDEVAIAWQPGRNLVDRATALVRHFPRSLRSLRASEDGRIKGSLEIWNSIRRLPGTLQEHFGPAPGTRFSFLPHHDCHAASAFLVSPFSSAAILTCDACGEWDTTVSYVGDGTRMQCLSADTMPHSLGLVYAAVTEFLGFKVKCDEGKVMALAAFGEPVYRRQMQGMFSVNGGAELSVSPEFFRFQFDTKSRFYSQGMCELFGPSQTPGAVPSRRDMDLAASLQEATERVLKAKVEHLAARTGRRDFCVAGGVGLNSKANGWLLEQKVVDHLFVQPAANDAGAALGAALLAYWRGNQGERPVRPFSPYLGPGTDVAEGQQAAARLSLHARRVPRPEELAAELLCRGKIVGWHQGRMEFGPRALGNRSILADPRRPEMKDHVNAKVKFREPFRPFGPAILAEAQREYFEVTHPVPFMTHVLTVRPSMRTAIPATVHADGTARLQSCSSEDNPLFHSLIRAFERRTRIPVVLNTSLNVAGTPIAAKAEQSLRCLAGSDLDYLIVADTVVWKDEASGRLVDDVERELGRAPLGSDRS